MKRRDWTDIEKVPEWVNVSQVLRGASNILDRIPDRTLPGTYHELAEDVRQTCKLIYALRFAVLDFDEAVETGDTERSKAAWLHLRDMANRVRR